MEYCVQMPTEGKEVTTIINRRIKPGHELEYANWFGRIVEAIKKAPGFRGITVIVPASKDSDARIILYRFADIPTKENWENSPERMELLSEVDEYATQSYDEAAGLETWFHAPGDQPS
jgi:antibiotic biosynthesis monooxygenase (ABM) superfamily enzyme